VIEYKPNGCGSSWWPVAWLRIPRWMSPEWSKFCDCHDLQYVDQKSKKIADSCLVWRLNRNTRESPPWQKPIKKMAIKIIRLMLSSKASEWCYKEAGKIKYENRRTEEAV
jgi:hypothetical protein